MKKAKEVDGVISQEFTPEECVDDESVTVAFLKIFRSGRVALMWSPLFFTNPNLPLPDELRAMLVEALRYHADKLESRDMDQRMRDLAGKMMGEA